jgi:ABC-2 type transport system permease protein
MRRLGFYLEILGAYAGNTVKSRLAYREDFVTGFLADLMTQAIGLAFVGAVFTRVPDIRGWHLAEILFIWGFAQVTIGLFYTVFLNLWDLSEEYIIEGRMDRVLLRPLPPLFQIITEKMYLEEISNVLVGIGLMIFATKGLHLTWGPLDVLVGMLLVLGGTAIYAGLYTVLVSLTFWFKDRGSMISPFVQMQTYSNYPVTLFNRQLQIVLTWVIPYAFTAFYPSMYYLHRKEFVPYVWLTPVMGLAFFLLGCFVFNRGVRSYESTGS